MILHDGNYGLGAYIMAWTLCIILIGSDCRRRPKRPRREAIERIHHGGWGVGQKNEEGERVTDFAMPFDLSIVNNFFEKRPNHLVTYKSGGRESQIDFLMCR